MEKSSIQKLSDQVQIYTPEEIGIIKNTVAKGFSDPELAYFLNVAKVYKLNPFTKQIWGYKDNKNNIIVFAGRDGFLVKAQTDPRWNGIASDIVRDGEQFSMNVAEGKISHQKDIASKAKILGAYARCKPKGCEIETIEWADFDTYNKGYNVWKSDPAAMIKKVAESHCLQKAYGLSGLACEEDFDLKGEKVYVRDHEESPSVGSIGYADELLRTSTYDDDMKRMIETKLCDQRLTNSELESIIAELKDAQPKKY
jgi:phage recombination protein Bet